MFYLVLAVFYLCIGFVVCRKNGLYEELFDFSLFEELFDHGNFKPLLRDALRFVLVTVFWPLSFIVVVVFGLLIAMLIVDEEEELKSED